MELLIVAVLVAQSEPTPSWFRLDSIVYPTAVVLLIALVTLIIRVVRLTRTNFDKPIALLYEAIADRDRTIERIETDRDRSIKRLERRIVIIEAEQRDCNLINALLIRTMQEHGLPVPAEAFRRRRRADDRLADFGSDFDDQ